MDVIKRAQEYAESIVKTVHEPLLILDLDLRVRESNRTFCELFHITPAETDNRLLCELSNGQWNITVLSQKLNEILLQNTVMESFLVEQSFDQIGQRTLLLNARLLIQTFDHSPLILLAIRDITERKQLEEKLLHRVEELATADRRKNEFLAMLAHEFRNPLAALRSGVQILKTPGVPLDADTKARDLIDRQIGNMAQMIDDLLDVHQMRIGTIPLRKEPVQLTLILKRAVELCSAQIESRCQQLTLSLPAEPIYIAADLIRLEQVFGNLLDNASKYSDRGGRIWLTSELVGDPGQPPMEVEVRVRDEGIGIAPEMLPHVFEMFVQVDDSLGRVQGGLGIGLTIVRTVVGLHGGSISTHSPGLGKGSEFVVRIPILQPADALQQSSKPKAENNIAGAAPIPVSSERYRILVVDDNLAVADSLALVLSLAGNEVQIAYDGQSALETAASFQPDVVLLDIGLPEMNGYEVARQLRQRNRNGRVVLLIAMTGYGQDEHLLRSREVGFDAHLVKPVDFVALQKLFSELTPRTS